MSGPHNKRVGREQTFYKISGLYADDTITAYLNVSNKFTCI